MLHLHLHRLRYLHPVGPVKDIDLKLGLRALEARLGDLSKELDILREEQHVLTHALVNNTSTPPPALPVSNDFYARIYRNANRAIASSVLGVTYIQHDFSLLGHDLKIYEDSRSKTWEFVRQEIAAGEYSLEKLHQEGMFHDGDIILDLGTNVGITAILMAKMFPTTRIIAVEPMPHNYIAAQRNLLINGVSDRITLLCAALASDPATTMTFDYNWYNSGASRAMSLPRLPSFAVDEEKAVVEAITMDEIIHHFNLTTVRFIKMDCEGCEYDVLPSLSPRARAMFREAMVAGETHCDLFEGPAQVKDYVHGFFDLDASMNACK